MLSFGHQNLPQCDLVYIAFRSAFVSTLRDHIMSVERSEGPSRPLGYLTEIPFLENVAAQVQLDVLADVWSRHSSLQRFSGSVIEEAVVYASCEFTASELENNPSAVAGFLAHGPRSVDLEQPAAVSSELRSLHGNLSSEGDFLMLSQFEDSDPVEAQAMMQAVQMERGTMESLLVLLGRWHVSANIGSRFAGLITMAEAEQLTQHLPAVDKGH